MQQKSTYILLGVFILLALIAFFLLRSPGERETSYSLADVRLSMDSATVQSVSIRRPTTSFTLQNIGGSWYVVLQPGTPDERRYNADVNAVKSFLGNLQKLKVTSLISSNPERQHLFQVDTASGTLLSYTDRNGTTISLYVGKIGPSFSETYVRPVNAHDVYLAEGIASWEVNRELKEWRDRTIFRAERDSIRRIVFRYANEQFTLVKDSLWRMQPQPKENINESNISALLGSLTNLHATDFVDTAVTLPKPQLILNLETPEPWTLQFFPLPPDSSNYWVKTSTTDQLFVVNKWNVQPLLKRRNDFLLK